MADRPSRRPDPSNAEPWPDLRSWSDDRRGVAPAVSKTLEIGLVVLFVALVTSVLLSGVLPGYRAAAGDELGERVLVTAGQEIEDAVPPDGRDAETRRSVDLPGTIAGSGYEIRTEGRYLVLEHPDSDVDGRVRLTLPPRVRGLDGTWQSGGESIVHVTAGSGGLVVELRNGGDA